MNLLGHAHVSLATGRDHPEEVLGAILPDLATMAGVRLERDRLPARVAAGVSSHHRADTAFHARGEFLRGAAAVRRELEAMGVGPGPARAVGHVGWELLLDGTLLGTSADEAYREALAGAGTPAVAEGVRDVDRARWALFLTRWGPAAVDAYGDPEALGERLWHILGRRPRLRLEAGHVPAVVDTMRRHAAAVRTLGPELLRATAEATTGVP